MLQYQQKYSACYIWIEVRVVNKKDLKLKYKVYECSQCGAILDIDLNAALNLRDTNKFKIA